VSQSPRVACFFFGGTTHFWRAFSIVQVKRCLFVDDQPARLQSISLNASSTFWRDWHTALEIVTMVCFGARVCVCFELQFVVVVGRRLLITIFDSNVGE
jgi:hypothetical protein